MECTCVDKTARELQREEIKHLCDILDFYDDLKREMIRVDMSQNWLIGIDKLSVECEKNMATIAVDMLHNDICSCDGINEGCSSPFCKSQYNVKTYKNYNEATHKKSKKESN